MGKKGAKMQDLELLVRAIELLEAYQVGSIPLEKLDSQTNKLIKCVFIYSGAWGF